MAKVRAVPAEVLDARRLTGADLLAMRAMLELVFDRPAGGHWATCPLDVSLCSFDVAVAVGGSCPTCEHIYETIRISMSCSCGARHRDTDLDAVALPMLLDKMRELATADGTPKVAAVAAHQLETAFDDLADDRADLQAELARSDYD